MCLIFTNLTFRGQCIVKYSYNKSQQDALFLNFILVKNSKCFGLTYLQHILQFIDNVHIYTSNLPIFKISVWQIQIAVITLIRLRMMDTKSVLNMLRSSPKRSWEIMHFVGFYYKNILMFSYHASQSKYY
jgi:hypothetical protein